MTSTEVAVTQSAAPHTHAMQKARHALDLIEQNGLAPDHRNYELWYAYALGRDRSLVSAMDALLARNGKITPEDMQQLYRNHSIHGQTAETSAKAGDQLADELDEICNMIELAIGSTRDYGHSLADISTDLDEDIERGKLRRLVASLAEKTKKSIDETGMLEANLRESRNDMNALRDVLNAVRTETLTDALTSLANRRHFEDVLNITLAAPAVKTAPLTLMMIDVDHFKMFNDTHGHRAGDQVLRLVAATIRQNLPQHATASRYGGEEFAMVMPGVRLTQAKQIADRIRRSLSAKDLVKVSSGESLGRITASVGVAELTRIDTPASLIERADQLVRVAKSAGRDRTIGEDEMNVQRTLKAG